MNGFVRWYLGRLRSHPMSTNVISAMVLMVTGDVSAQEIEIHYFGTPKPEEEIQMDRLSFRRYGTLSPDVRTVQAQLKRRQTEAQAALAADEILLTTMSQWRNTARSVYMSLQSELESLDLFRSATMAFWSGFLSTPTFILLYRLFDKMLPASTPQAIAARVGITFLMSIPVNAAFFTYGTFVHHVTEWTALISEWRCEVPDASVRQVLRRVPFDFPMFWSTARLKIETELVRTVMASASIWIPINAINFTFVPPHLRPLTLTTFSAFWNCYLSLAQHREAKIDTE